MHSILFAIGRSGLVKFVDNIKRGPLIFQTNQLSREAREEKGTMSATNLTERNEEMLKRISVIEDVETSAAVVDKLIELNQPIAVDMEGIQNSSVTGLIQIRDKNGNFSIFRTSKNPDLYHRGRLKELLEMPTILKVMHALTNDCLSVYKDGVKMWGLYDTAVAQKVLEYQCRGIAVSSAPSMGLNSLCEYCGLEGNPIKGRIPFYVDNAHRTYNAKVLSTKFLLYCAWDVEQLLQIHDVLRASITTDYEHLVQQLTDLEVIRSIDPHLAKTKMDNMRNVEACSIFLQNLPTSVKKPDLYRLMAPINGHKHVYFSNLHNSAQLILDSRTAAIAMLDRVKRSHDILGSRIDCKMVVEIDPTELNETNKHPIINTNADFLDKLLRAEVPIVIDFKPVDTDVLIEIFLGRGPTHKIPITKDFIDAGLGELMESNKIVKILFSLETGNVLQALKLLTQHNVKVNNVFELDCAAKYYDYLECGQSVFAPPRKIRKISEKFGIVAPTNRTKELQYLLYLHLCQAMPTTQLNKFMKERTDIEIGVGAYEDISKYKEQRTELKHLMDLTTIHIRLLGNYKKLIGKEKVHVHKSIENLVTKTIIDNNFSIIDYVNLGRCQLVQLDNKKQTVAALDLLKELENVDPDLRFQTHLPCKPVTEMPTVPPANNVKLVENQIAHLERLEQIGLANMLITSEN